MLDPRPGDGHLAGGAHRGDRHSRLSGCCGCHSLRLLGPRALQGDPVVSGVELRQHGSGPDELVVFKANLEHRAGDPAADLIEMPVYLRVVGAFPQGGVPPEKQGGGRQHQGQHYLHRSGAKKRLQVRFGGRVIFLTIPVAVIFSVFGHGH